MKKVDETFSEYRQRIMNPISATFCAAKWFNATIWLDSGLTTSCHHPPAHEINEEQIEKDPTYLHNTMLKKVERELMLKGARPPGCEYCWKIEDIDSTLISDRVFKTEVYTDDDIQLAASTNPRNNFTPRRLEIAFDSTCQLACIYCNSSFSSKWQNDIRQSGFYNDLDIEDSERVNHTGVQNNKKNNKYVKAFWRWLPELENSLAELRITGGEPLLNPNTWKLLDYFTTSAKCQNITLAINSNLACSPNTIHKLITYGKSIKHLDLYTSCEASHQTAEYIRDGIHYLNFINNIKALMESQTFNSINIMMTINILSLFDTISFLNDILHLKKLSQTTKLIISINILRFPTFLSISNLPLNLRQTIAHDISTWQKKHGGDFTDMEMESLSRLTAFLKVENNISFNKNSLKSFLKQYDFRRHKDLKSAVPMIYNWLYHENR